MTLGKLLNVFEPQNLHLYNNNSTYFQVCWVIICVKDISHYLGVAMNHKCWPASSLRCRVEGWSNQFTSDVDTALIPRPLIFAGLSGLLGLWSCGLQEYLLQLGGNIMPSGHQGAGMQLNKPNGSQLKQSSWREKYGKGGT